MKEVALNGLTLSRRLSHSLLRTQRFLTFPTAPLSLLILRDLISREMVLCDLPILSAICLRDFPSSSMIMIWERSSLTYAGECGPCIYSVS